MTRKLASVGLIAWAFLLVAAAVGHGVAAYIGTNPYSVHLDAPLSVPCSSQAVVTATVRSADTGVLVPGQSINWDLKRSVSSQDHVGPRNTVTDQNGQSSVTVTFGDVSGTRTVRATIATFPATIDVTCTGGAPGPTGTPIAGSQPPTGSSAPTPSAPTPSAPVPSLPAQTATPSTSLPTETSTPSLAAASPVPTLGGTGVPSGVPTASVPVYTLAPIVSPPPPPPSDPLASSTAQQETQPAAQPVANSSMLLLIIAAIAALFLVGWFIARRTLRRR